MVKTIKYFIIVLFAVYFTVDAQSNNKIEEHNVVLQNLRSEISSLQSKLNDLSDQEKKSLQALQNINRQNLLISQIITKLKQEENQKEREIHRLNYEIAELESEIEKLRDDYSNYLVWLYKHRKGSFLKFLLSAESINQAVIRYKYLNYITSEKQDILNQLKDKKKRITNMIEVRENEKREKERLVVEKETEQQALIDKKIVSELIITSLQEDQNALLQEIDEKRKAEIQIKNLIAIVKW